MFKNLTTETITPEVGYRGTNPCQWF